MKRLYIPPSRRHAFGSRLPCTVLESHHCADGVLVICEFVDGDRKEGHILIFKELDVIPQAGDVGELVFTKGGPMGGYFKYEATNANQKT